MRPWPFAECSRLRRDPCKLGRELLRELRSEPVEEGLLQPQPARQVDRLPEEPDGADVTLEAPAAEARCVKLLTVLGRHLVAAANVALPQRVDANFRLSIGQSLLDVRDAIKRALVADGQLPERREGSR